MKQLYPPPGTVEEPPVEGAPKALPFASRRTPRGPMMRGPKAEPPPKGKVRQLYPPPEFDEAPPGSETPAFIREPHDERMPDSMFVTGSEELDERRRLARERADARRSDERAPGHPMDDDFSSEPASPAIRPPFGSPFDDEDI